MKSIIKILVSIIVLIGNTFGQSGPETIYKNLDVKKDYSVRLTAQTGSGGDIYEVNGKKVSKSIYDKYKSTRDDANTCCPCILKIYNESDILLKELVACGDCGVGYFKKYYPNGKLKISGHYKENPTGNWEDIWDRGFCNVKNGQWTYFDESGDTTYMELWDDGDFISQEPQQSGTQIWKVELLLNGEFVEQNQQISLEQIKNLKVVPQYKTINTNSKLTIEFEVSAVGYQENEQVFTLESFKDIDVKQMLADVKIPGDFIVNFTLTVYSEGTAIKRFFIKAKT